jgi:non-heme chloroperoxidase
MVKGSNNNQIAIDTWGEPSNPAVILMHGGGQTRHAWKGTGQKLADANFYAISMDLRGHGDSDWVDSEVGYTEAELAADLVCVIKELKLNKPVLVGASLGGMAALTAIGFEMTEAGALVLVDIVPGFTKSGAARVLQFMAMGAKGFDSLDEIKAIVKTYQSHRKSSHKSDGLSKNVRLGDDGRYYWHWDPAFLKRSADDFLLVQDALKECAKNINVPTLLVRGGLSDLLTDEGAQEFLKSCPQADYTNVTDAAHMVAGDRNDIFTEAVISFLKKMEA